jgi:hypothetical protein
MRRSRAIGVTSALGFMSGEDMPEGISKDVLLEGTYEHIAYSI